jgi:hypothetical protein
MNAATRILAPLLLLGVVLAGCGGDGLADGSSAPPKAAAKSEASSPGTSTTVAQAPCDAQEFLPVLKRTFDDESKKLRIVRADIERCRNDYAQVFAAPDQTVCEPGVGYCYETEQVFLHWTGDRWRMLFWGTGIACGAEFETDARVVRVCAELGYPPAAATTS